VITLMAIDSGGSPQYGCKSKMCMSAGTKNALAIVASQIFWPSSFKNEQVPTSMFPMIQLLF